MMNNTEEEQPRERCSWAGAVNYLGEFDRLLDAEPDAPILW